MKSVLIYTYSMSPYQVEFLDELDKFSEQLCVLYHLRTERGRMWSGVAASHDHLFWRESDLQLIFRCIQRSDIVVISGYNTLSSLVLLILSRMHGKVVVFWGERFRGAQTGLISCLSYFYKRIFLSLADYCFAIGVVALHDYSKISFQTDQTSYVPYYSKLKRFFDLELKPRKARNIVFIGEFSSRKGVDLILGLIESCSIRLAALGFTITFVGSGPLEKEVSRVAFNFPSLVSVKGFVPWAETHLIYEEADIIMVPSLYDGWCLVVVEAMAAGRIVISTVNTGAAYERIKEGENGFLLADITTEALYEKLNDVSKLSVEKLQFIRENARRSVRDLDVSNGVNNFLKSLDEAKERSL